MNLKKMMATGCFNDVLELKLFLIKHKKNGEVFYLPDIISLDLDEEFEFFYYLSKPPYAKKGAFPILRRVFENNPSEEKLMRLCANYYDTDSLSNSEFFHNLSVYKGSEWVWLYNNKVLEGF